MESLSLVGGRPCLDFANTEGGERNGPPERLASYDDLLAWCVHAGVMDAGLAQGLEEEARSRPSAARRVLQRAIELREALYGIFSAAAAGRSPLSDDMEVLDRELAEAFAHRRLVPEQGRFRWRFDLDEGRLDMPLWWIVDDAAGLLSSESLGRVKECGGPDCAWIFLDESRNHSRRWCDMGECGNRAKARRYRRRHGG